MRSQRPLSATRIATRARDLLEASALCAIATADARGRSHINTTYFAWSVDFELVWLSEPRAKHSKNLAANESAAIAVFDSSQTWGEPDRGIQLFVRARLAEGDVADAARALYGKRFPRFGQGGLEAYYPYLFRAERIKLFDERELGGGTFVTARIGADRKPVWERTEIYSPDA